MTVVVPARACPPSILARTRNAKAAVAKAEAGGWVSLCTYAVGGDEYFVQSILLRVQRGPVAMSACWTGPVGAVDKYGRPAGLGFDGAWRKDGGDTRKITYTEFSHYLTDPSTEPAPGKVAEATAAKEQEEMLVAIALTAEGLDATFVRTHPGETCEFHVMQGPPFGRQRCTNGAVPGSSYCAGPCVRE